MKPKDIKKKHEKFLLDHVFKNDRSKTNKTNKINNFVRVSKKSRTNLTTYKLEDSEGNSIKGGFYAAKSVTSRCLFNGKGFEEERQNHFY